MAAEDDDSHHTQEVAYPHCVLHADVLTLPNFRSFMKGGGFAMSAIDPRPSARKRPFRSRTIANVSLI